MTDPQDPPAPADPTEGQIPPPDIIKSTDSLSASYAAYTVTFLLAMMYIVIAVLGTTDAQLLLDQPISLPFISLGVPAKSFYIGVPLFLLGLHINVIFVEFILESRLVEWNIHRNLEVDQIYPSLPVIRRFDSTAAPVGPFFARLWYWSIAAYLPPSLILLMQAQFVRSHYRSITVLHRLVLLADILVIIFLVARSTIELVDQDGKNLPQLRSKRARLITPRSILNFLAVRLYALRPGSNKVCRLKGRPTTWINAAGFLAVAAILLHASNCYFIFSTCEAPERMAWPERMLKRWYPVNLRLQGVITDSGDREGGQAHGYVDLRGRDLQCANFSEGKLENVDFRGAKLAGAKFLGTDLRGANFSALPSTDGQRGDPANCSPDALWGKFTDLRQVRLIDVDLTGAQLQNADLKDSTIRGGKLAGTNFCFAKLQNARLESLMAAGAKFEGATLKGVSCTNCRIEFGDFENANLTDAILVDASLVGASFAGAETEGVDFRGADLNAARLPMLTAVNLRNAHLVGTEICRGDNPSFRLIDFRGVRLSPPLENPRLAIATAMAPAEGLLASPQISEIRVVAEAKQRIEEAHRRIEDLGTSGRFTECLAPASRAPAVQEYMARMLAKLDILYDNSEPTRDQETDANRLPARDRVLALWPRSILREADFRRKMLERIVLRACSDKELFDMIKARTLYGSSPQDLDFRLALAKRLSQPPPAQICEAGEPKVTLEERQKLSRIAAMMETGENLKQW